MKSHVSSHRDLRLVRNGCNATDDFWVSLDEMIRDANANTVVLLTWPTTTGYLDCFFDFLLLSSDPPRINESQHIYVANVWQMLGKVGLDVVGQEFPDLRIVADRHRVPLRSDRDPSQRANAILAIWKKAAAKIGPDEVKAGKIVTQLGKPHTLPRSMANTLIMTINRRLRVLKATPSQPMSARPTSPQARCLKAFAHRLNLHVRHSSIRQWLELLMEPELRKLFDKARATVGHGYLWTDQHDNLRVLENIIMIELNRYSLTAKRQRIEDTPVASAFASPTRGEGIKRHHARDQFGNRYRLEPTDEPGELDDIMIVIPTASFQGMDGETQQDEFPVSKPDTSVDEERDDPMRSPTDAQE